MCIDMCPGGHWFAATCARAFFFTRVLVCVRRALNSHAHDDDRRLVAGVRVLTMHGGMCAAMCVDACTEMRPSARTVSSHARRHVCGDVQRYT